MSRCMLAVALVCAVSAQALKRAESESLVSPVPFTFAARYGRSPERQITPRHDRWMFTSRYGKRSPSDESLEQPPHKEKYNPPFLKSPFLRGDLETPLFLQNGHEDPPFLKEEKQSMGKTSGKALYCEYTGIMSLYNCSSRRKSAMDAFARRNDGSSSETDEV